ncbi:hypothetical protein [Priestia flexa]|uniref:hypothetical protein n=1 Tax=Priestia flexa TaxID=86664 RepID=UPI000472FDEB|nr:hypothetical protein [Priestia flexa]
MIQEYLMNKGKELAPHLMWTVDYYSNPIDTGTVFYEGGSPGNKNSDVHIRYPQYMFYIRTKNWSEAEVIAHRLYKTLHLSSAEGVHVPELDTTYRVFLMEASEPIRLGVIDDVMVYSLNIQVTLREE